MSNHDIRTRGASLAVSIKVLHCLKTFLVSSRTVRLPAAMPNASAMVRFQGQLQRTSVEKMDEKADEMRAPRGAVYVP